MTRIYLVGYMASGKSRTGKALAAALKWKFTDTDSLVEEQAKMTVQQIFSIHGEEYFRKLEAEVIRKTGELKKTVIATGGGLPCFHGNIQWMNESGLTIYLEASEGLLFHRLATSKQGRPLVEGLNDVELMELISRHLIERTPFYNKAAITVPAISLDLKSLLKKIEKQK